MWDTWIPVWIPPEFMKSCLGGSLPLPQKPWNWSLDNLSLSRKVNGNIWRTATVDQPAAEPDSYWVRFPDDSILRRTRSMIKPRSLPSHFELQAEAQQRNFEGDANSHSCDSFSQSNK